MNALFAAAVAIALATPSLAQHAAHPPGMAMPMPMPTPGAAPDAGSMMSAMDTMSRDMAAVPMTGDADRDFAGMMVPHHRGAIDMARYELAQGKDPAMRRLARAIVAAQDREIAQMRAWLAKHPVAR